MAGPLELSNGEIKLAVDSEGRLRELTNVRTGYRYLATPGQIPWRMFYKTGSYPTGEAINVEILPEGQVSSVKREGDSLVLNYERLKVNLPLRGKTREFEICLVLRATMQGDRLVWMVTIENRERGVEITEIWVPLINGIGDLGLGRAADILYWPEFAGRRSENPLSSAKTTIVVKRPPSPGDIHGATRRAQTFSQRGNRLAACVYGRWPEHCPSWVPEFQDLTRSVAVLGRNGFPTL